MKKLKHLANDQRGMASIIVAVTLMLIISLIVLAMSQNTQNEQRQALDRQLSDQAFYNAETGINDVASYLYEHPDAAVDKTRCDTSLPSISSQIDGDGPDGVNKYTCLLYDKAPKSLQYDSVSISSPKIIPIQTVNDAGGVAALQRLTIAWDDAADRNGNIGGACNFTDGSPAMPAECGYGGVRVEVIRPNTSRDAMRESSLIAFLLPNNGAVGGDIAVGGLGYPDNQGLIRATNCSNTTDTSKRRCSKTITQIGTGNLYLSIRSLYRPVNITITGFDSSNNALRFKDTQTVVDSTGKANDVLRRVQVRIPAKAQYVYPGYALQSRDSICKVLKVSRNDAGIGNVATDDPAACPLN